MTKRHIRQQIGGDKKQKMLQETEESQTTIKQIQRDFAGAGKNVALYNAVFNYDYEAAVEAIKNGASAKDTKDDVGRSLLFFTVQTIVISDFPTQKDEILLENRQQAAVKNFALLLENGADPNSYDDRGQTILAKAILARDADFEVDLLLKKGANPNLLSISGGSPLYNAIRLNKIIAAKFLLEHNACLQQEELIKLENQLIKPSKVFYFFLEVAKLADMIINHEIIDPSVFQEIDLPQGSHAREVLINRIKFNLPKGVQLMESSNKTEISVNLHSPESPSMLPEALLEALGALGIELLSDEWVLV